MQERKSIARKGKEAPNENMTKCYMLPSSNNVIDLAHKYTKIEINPSNNKI